MNKVFMCFTAISFFAIGASSAYAKQDGDDMPAAKARKWADSHFKEMDSNGDDAITKAEFDAFHTKHFQDIDSNGDGKLTREEMRDGHKEKREKAKGSRFEEADADHDNSISREEAKKLPRLSKHFDKIDANKDGKLERQELEASMEKMRQNRN